MQTLGDAVLDDTGESLHGALGGEDEASVRTVRLAGDTVCVEDGAHAAHARLVEAVLKDGDKARREAPIVASGRDSCREDLLVGVGGGGFGLEEEDRDLAAAGGRPLRHCRVSGGSLCV